MLAAVCVGTNNLKNSGVFYDAVLAILNYSRVMENSSEIGYALADNEPTFYVLTPFNKQPATYGNGSQIMFRTDRTDTVDRFYQTAMDYGGVDEGAPGPRDYSENYYGAYIRDLDGNKLHAFYSPHESS